MVGIDNRRQAVRQDEHVIGNIYLAGEVISAQRGKCQEERSDCCDDR